MQYALRLLLLSGEGCRCTIRRMHPHVRRHPRALYKLIYRSYHYTGSNIYMARRRSRNGTLEFLPKGTGVATTLRTRAPHYQLPANQRHIAHRCLVPLSEAQRLVGGCINRRAPVTARLLSSLSYRQAYIPIGNALHTSLAALRRRVERHGCNKPCKCGSTRRIYRFFKSIGCQYLQFTPIVERRRPDGRLAAVDEQGVLTDESITPQQWGRFLCRLFDIWVKEDVGNFFVQIFDATLARHYGVSPGVCSMATVCGHAGVVDYNGDVYSCDHFVFPAYRIGNIHHNSIIELMSQERQFAFGQAKRDSLPDQCRQCRHMMICNGECPKNRFSHTADGQPGLNYLCEGYRAFFDHTEPHMRFMVNQLRRGLPPADIMRTPIEIDGD